MIHENINLKIHFPSLPNDVFLTTFCWKTSWETPYKKPRAATIVLPGGGYNFCSEREATPVAIRLMANDITTFVLNYTIGKFKHPLPLVEVFAAVAYIRNNADKYNVDPNNIGVLGFSAGGNLAGITSLYFNDEEYLNFLGLNAKDTKINHCVMGYPVIDLYDIRKEHNTTDNITQGDKKLLEKFTVYKNVTQFFPPCFIWTTKEDSIVPYFHSVLMKEALEKNNVKYEFHLYDKGEHGGSTCDSIVNPENVVEVLKPAKEWIELAANFIKNL